MLAAMLMLAAGAPPPPTADDLLESYRRLTAVTIRCPIEATPGEVVVCGRRRADRYRLPLDVATVGSRADPLPSERVAMLAPPSPCAELSIFLVGCGHVGFGMGVSGDGRTRVLRPRELSP